MTDAVADPWRKALRLWNVALHPPEIRNGSAARIGSFAWFSFPPTVHIDFDDLHAEGLADHLDTVFAHEIGHHVLAPSTRIASLKITHLMGRGLSASGLAPARLPATAALTANLWCDILINNRIVSLQRDSENPGMIAMWRILYRPDGPRTPDPLFWVILRAYEILWSLPAGDLCPVAPPESAGAQSDSGEPDAPSDAPRTAAQLTAQLARLTVRHPVADAQLLAALARSYATDPIGGALPCAMLLSPYLIDDPSVDPAGPGGGFCDGTPDIVPTASELDEIMGDRRLSAPPVHPGVNGSKATTSSGRTGGQSYGLADTLALYAGAPRDAVLSAWYQSRARPWVRPLCESTPTTERAQSIPGPTELWEVGDDLAELDWPASLGLAPSMIPGVTTRRRAELPDDPDREYHEVELDLYVDSSGSMPHPEQESPPILAGTILALSVLAAGGHVRVTSFAGPRQVGGTTDFTRNRAEVMAALLTFFGGGTTFPLDLLDQRYRPRALTRGSTHLIVLSDDGLASMFGAGQDVYAVVAARIRPLLASAALILIATPGGVDAAARQAGYDVAHVPTVDEVPDVCAGIAQTITNGPARDDRHD
ncbi:hypothetical protein AAFP30_11055 [Gordonia sp. CPCC 205515]|uniref:hypothetical protein n=1 Tax=Gordonia sp. CPCC 205515 TaxID=3140791 RepID=UPI003AF3E57F